MRQVVDASALLAYLLDEPGGALVGDEDGPLCLSSINLAEVLTRGVDRGLAPEIVLRALKQLPIEHVDHARDDAMRTAALRRVTRRHGLSLGDRACLALAQRLMLPVLTADKAWLGLDHGLDVRLIH